MNKDLRLALLRDDKDGGKEWVIDFTCYDPPAKESADPEPGKHLRNWSIINRINQKGARPKDKPIPLSELTAEEHNLIRKHYPDLINR